MNKVKVIKSDSLRILYYNARSLLPKLDELSATIEAHDFPDVVCIAESWLCHDIREQEIAIPNYNVFRHDRNRLGGGILLYVEDTYITSELPGTRTDLEIITICVQSEIVKHAFHFFIDPPVHLQLFLILFVHILESLNIALYSHLFCLGILMLILHIHYILRSFSNFCVCMTSVNTCQFSQSWIFHYSALVK